MELTRIALTASVLLPLVSGPYLIARQRVIAPGEGTPIWSGQTLRDHVGGQLERVKPSNDGQWLAFVDWSQRGNVAVRNTATGEIRRVTNGPVTENAYFPALSPDGTHVAFSWSAGGGSYSVQIASVDGSRPRVLWQQDGVYPRNITWAPDGQRLALVLDDFKADRTSRSTIALISVDTGAVTPVKVFSQKPTYASAARESLLGGFSPDGRFLVYALPSQPPSTPGGIFVMATDGSQETALAEGATGDRFPSWTPDGTAVVFVSDRSGNTGLWSISVRDGKPASQPALLRGNVGPIDGLGFASDGTYFYATLNLRRSVYWAGFDPATVTITSPPSPLVDSLADANGGARWSPDGRLLSFVRTRQADVSVMIRSADGSERALPARFRTDGVDAMPSWFPDGRSLLLPEIDRTSRWSTFRKVSIDNGQSSVALDGPNWERRGLIGPSPDGKAVYYTKAPDTHDSSVTAIPVLRLVRRDLGTGNETELYQADNAGVFFPAAISPDGDRLAFMAGSVLRTVPTDGRTPPTEIARETFLRAPAQEQSLVWSRDGRYVLVVGRDAEKGQQVWACPAAGGEPRKLDLTMEQIQLTDVSPDGRRLAFTGTEREPEIWAIRNLLR